jgi:predicted negative regulator of RcsB-dependent stress response
VGFARTSRGFYRTERRSSRIQLDCWSYRKISTQLQRKQPGDPKKAAQAITQLTQEPNPPLRLLLGSDAYAAVEKNDLARLEEARVWKELSVSTDFEIG